MKNSLIFLLLLLFTSLSYAEETKQYGFQDIPFGTPFNEVKKKLEKKYLYGLTRVRALENYILIHNFKLGGLDVDVHIEFDHNSNFYAFSFTSKRYVALKLNTDLKNAADYLSEVFRHKYGQPEKCNDMPEVLEINPGHVSFLCQWHHPELEIFTAIPHYELNYYAAAYVRSKKMVKAMEAVKGKEEPKDAAAGAEAF